MHQLVIKEGSVLLMHGVTMKFAVGESFGGMTRLLKKRRSDCEKKIQTGTGDGHMILGLAEARLLKLKKTT